MGKLFEIEDNEVNIYDLPYSFSVDVKLFVREANKIIRKVGSNKPVECEFGCKGTGIHYHDPNPKTSK